jgi:phosphate transport system substrate-binding protein
MKFNFTAFVLLVVTTTSFLITGCTSTNTVSSKTDNNISQNQNQTEIKITGSSSSYRSIKLLAESYEIKNKNIKANFLPANQSETAIAGVQEGIFEIASISKALKPEENDGTLQYQEVAKDALLVATNSSVKGVKNLTAEQLKGIYSGKIKNWKEVGGHDGQIVVLDRPEDESAKRLLRKYYLGQELKNSPEAVILREEGDLISAIQNTPNSIGAFSLAYAIANKLPVNHLSLNGVEALPENVKSGQYPMVRIMGIVFKKNSNDRVKQFIDFILSKEGSRILSKAGFSPSTEK